MLLQANLAARQTTPSAFPPFVHAPQASALRTRWCRPAQQQVCDAQGSVLPRHPGAEDGAHPRRGHHVRDVKGTAMNQNHHKGLAGGGRQGLRQQ